MPVGRRFTRQNTRDLTEMQSQVIAANAPRTLSDPMKEAILLDRRDTEFANDLDQQEFRKDIFKRQGSLRSILL